PDHEDEERRGEAPGTADPERLQIDPPAPLVFVQEQRSDEEAGENEEEIDAEVPSGERGIGVIDQHAGYGDATQTVERGEVAEGGVRRRAHATRLARLADGPKRCHRENPKGAPASTPAPTARRFREDGALAPRSHGPQTSRRLRRRARLPGSARTI